MFGGFEALMVLMTLNDFVVWLLAGYSVSLMCVFVFWCLGFVAFCFGWV